MKTSLERGITAVALMATWLVAGVSAQPVSQSDALTLALVSTTSAGGWCMEIDDGRCTPGDNSATVTATTAERIDCALGHDSAGKGQWTLAWGPVVIVERVSKDPPQCIILHKQAIPAQRYFQPANTMFVVQNRADPDLYVVAIAGSNRTSAYDWCVEDFDVKTLVPWPYSHPLEGANAAIDHGTAIGLSILTKMKPRSKVTHVAGEGQLLAGFLGSIAGEREVEVVVVGHSLGGTLAPLTALWLADTQTDWDPRGNATVSTVAFAGATPGNQALAEHVERKLPGNRAVVVDNTYDVIPRLWNDLGNVRTLYDEGCPKPWMLSRCPSRPDSYCPCFASHMLLRHLTNLPPAAQTPVTDKQPMPGARVVDDAELRNCPIVVAAMNPDSPRQKPLEDKFMLQALYQHFCAYPLQLGVPDLLDQLNTCQEKYPFPAFPSK